MAPLLVQEVDDGVSPPSRLNLTDVEMTLRNLLLNVAEYIDSLPAPTPADTSVILPEELAKEPLVLRWTGGWVRDKLLGVPSHDIDVAINKMTGYSFGLRMKEYLEIPGNLEKYGLESIAANDKQNQKAGATDKSKTVGGLHKIEANPEKSKHLETTTVRILGLDVDLVNLRKETYSDDSRNPQMEFGTPEEDALRRDATVNAMFYNLNTEEIEDFTGQGHRDMSKKIIRTPLEPYQTFKDDPLRVLRLIRFASRLGYTIEHSALEAMRNPDIKDALRRKISRERVGTEVEKALQGPDPHEALRLIFSLDLYETIFSDPAVANTDHYTPDTEGWRTIIDGLKDLLSGGDALSTHLVRDKEDQFLAWQLAALVPYRDAPQPEPSEPGRKPPPPTAVTVAREGVKATNKTIDVILPAVRNQSEISSLVDKLHEKKRRPDKPIEGEDPAARDVLGMAMRRWGTSWRSQILYSMMVDIAENQDQLDTIERRYRAFIDHICGLELIDVCSFKPLLDGKVLAKAIGTPPGPWMKDALDVVMAWQLRYPNSNDPQQAIEEVKNQQSNGELKHDLIRHFLKLTIRPLFIKASSSSVTEQGRKVITPALPKKLTMQSEEESVAKPWKHVKDAYSLDILQWVVANLNERFVAEVWPLVVPPILTLLDDWETKYKSIGADRLNGLLQSTPTPLLQRTGLGDVFEEALMPCLTYLPSITPEDECVRLLSATFPALLTLSRVRYPKTSHTSMSLDDNHRDRTKSIDSVLRKGIIYGYSHCSAYPKIITLLFSHLCVLLDELGIDSVKHIKYVLPMLTETLSHPLAGASAPMLHEAVNAMQALIRNCWPRMLGYRGEVLKGLTFCWLQTQDGEIAAESEGIRELEAKMKETVRLLEVVVRMDCDFRKDCEDLVEADSRLRGLLLP